MKNDRFLVRLSVAVDSIDFSTTDILKDKENKEDILGDLIEGVYKENRKFCTFLLKNLNKISKEEINLRKNTVQEIYKCMEDSSKEGATVFNFPIEALTLPEGLLGNILSIEYALNYIEKKLMFTIHKYKMNKELKMLKEKVIRLIEFVDKELLITQKVKKVKVNNKSKYTWYIQNTTLYLSKEFYNNNKHRVKNIGVIVK